MAHAEKHGHGTPAARSITETAPKASLIMLLSGLFLLLIMTASALNSPAPANISAFFAPTALYIGVGVGGIFCGVRLQGTQGYTCAALAAVMLTAVLLAAKLWIPAPEEHMTLAVGIILHLILILAAILGALIANRLPKKKRRKKSKYRSKL